MTEALGDLSQELKTFKWQNVRLLVSAGKVDKRKTIYKTLEKIGKVEAFAGWSAEMAGHVRPSPPPLTAERVTQIRAQQRMRFLRD